MNNCGKCGQTAAWTSVDLLDVLCIDCNDEFAAWCKMMDSKYVSFEFDEFLAA